MPRKRKNKTSNRQYDFMFLDGSGSMLDYQSDVVGGVNSLIDAGTKEDPDDRFWLIVFSGAGQIRRVYENTRFGDVKPVTQTETYIGNNTAYLDAVGSVLSELSALDLVGKKVVTIYTDGLENASREWTKPKLKGLIETLQGKGDWTFTFMSADLEQTAEATSIGIPVGNYATVRSATSDSNFVALSSARSAHKHSFAGATSDFMADYGVAGLIDEDAKKKGKKPR